MTRIYALRNTVNDIVYVGQTRNSLQNRLSHHKGQTTDNSSIHTAMKEIGKDKFYIELLEEVTDDEADNKEIEWMERLKSHGIRLYNDKFTPGRCGGDTLTGNKNIGIIREKIRSKCIGGNNNNASRVIVTDIIDNSETVYDSMSECQKAMGIDRHDIISRRCRGQIKKPYKNRFVFKYA